MELAKTEAIPQTVLANVERAAQALLDGGAVIYPTETFYGLGAAILVAESVERIFQLKGRPSNKPLPLIASDKTSAKTMWSDVPPLAETLMDAFWPGPLTIILPASERVPECVAPFGEVGVRVSPNPLARLLASRVGPIIATSANLSGKGEKTVVSQLDEALVSKVAFVLDGGATPGGLPSTVLRLAGDQIHILREGAISRETIEGVLGHGIEQ